MRSMNSAGPVSAMAEPLRFRAVREELLFLLENSTCMVLRKNPGKREASIYMLPGTSLFPFNICPAREACQAVGLD